MLLSNSVAQTCFSIFHFLHVPTWLIYAKCQAMATLKGKEWHHKNCQIQTKKDHQNPNVEDVQAVCNNALIIEVQT